MFSDNQRISHRQMKRQIVLTFAGPLLLLVSGAMAAGGRNAAVGGLLGYGALLLFLFFVVRNGAGFQNLSETFGGTVKWLVCLIYGSFLVLTGGLLLELTAKISQLYLLPGVNTELLKLLFLACAALGLGTDVQKCGRMAEVAFPWIFWGFVLLLVVAAFHMEPPRSSQVPKLEPREVLNSAWGYFAVGCTVSLFPLACVRAEGGKSQMRELGKCWLLLTLLTLSAALILLGTYGYEGVGGMELPVLRLMSGTSLPGGFLERFDILWMALLLFSLLFTMGSLLFYSAKAAQRTMGQGAKADRIILWGAALLMWGVSGAQYQGIGIADIYRTLLEFVYAPLFVVLVPLAGWGKRRLRYENRSRACEKPKAAEAPGWENYHD